MRYLKPVGLTVAVMAILITGLAIFSPSPRHTDHEFYSHQRAVN